MATILKKMSAKTVCGNVKKLVAEIAEETNIECYRMFGVITGYEQGETNFGIWTAFRGNFESINHEGESFKAVKAFIPEPIDGMIKEQIDLLEKANAEETELAKKEERQAILIEVSLEFAIIVEAKRRDDLAIGYEYITKPLVEMQKNDSLSHLRTAALEAPKTEVQLLEVDDKSTDDDNQKTSEKKKAKK